MRFAEVSAARHTLKLAPSLTARTAIDAYVPAAQPAPVGTTKGGTKVHVGGDGTPAAPGEGDHGWGQSGRLGTFISPLLTGFAKQFVDQSSKRLGFFGALMSTRIGLRGRIRHTGWVVAQSDMNEQTDQYESNQQ